MRYNLRFNINKHIFKNDLSRNSIFGTARSGGVLCHLVPSLPKDDAGCGSGDRTSREAVPTYQFDVDQDKEAASEADIQSLPTFIIYGNGEEKWRHSGEIDGNVLLAKVQSFL